MKSHKILLLSIALTALVLGSLAAFSPIGASAGGKKKALTACEKAQLKYKPAVDEFIRRYVTPGFNPSVAYQQIRKQSGTSELAIMKYRALSPDQRRQLWDNRFNSLIQDEEAFGDFTSAQQAYLVKLKNLIPTLDFSGAQSREAVQPMIDESLKLFSKSQAKELFSVLTTAETAIPAKAAPGQCNCNITDSGPGTGGGWDCTAVQYCGLTDCQGSYGCGWLHIFYCGGKCFNDH